MQEVPLTFQRLLSVWWLLLWRGWLGGIIIGGIAGGVVGIIATLMGQPQAGSAVGGLAGIAVGPFWGLLVIHWALRKRYKDFQIILVRRDDVVSVSRMA